MDQFKAAFLEILKMLLQNPPGEGQQTVVLIVAAMAGAWVFLKVCDKFDIPNVGLVTGFLYALLGGAVTVAAMAAGRIYLGEWQRSLGDATFYSVVGLAASLVVFVPLLNHFIQGKFMGTLTAWLLAAATFATAVMLVNVLFDMGRDGQRILNRGAERNAATKEMTR